MTGYFGKTKVLANGLRIKRRWGLKSKNQLSLFLVWDEEWFGGEVIYAQVVFNSRDWIGV